MTFDEGILGLARKVPVASLLTADSAECTSPPPLAVSSRHPENSGFPVSSPWPRPGLGGSRSVPGLPMTVYGSNGLVVIRAVPLSPYLDHLRQKQATSGP